MNQDKVMKLENKINNDYKNIAGVVVLKDGKLEYENYFNGCNSSSTIHIYSVTKSIVSVLIGIAIDKGYIKSINQKILYFFPEYIVKDKDVTIQNVTLKDMMTMTTPYKHEVDPYIEYFTSNDFTQFALDSIGGEGRIGDFRYAPLVGPDILSAIILRATKKSVLDFAKEHLFSPLQINVEKNIIFNSQEEQFAFYEATNISGWVVDKTGLNTAGWGLTLTARDMAKIGQLYLNKGTYNKKEIVSTKWIEESTKVHSRWEELNLYYGYLWWINDGKEHRYAAIGDGGNVIYVNTYKNIVVSIASLFEPNVTDRIEFIKEYIEPIFL